MLRGKTFNILQKNLDNRDLLVIKLLHEIKDKSLTGNILRLIDERTKSKDKGHTYQMQIDVTLNKYLREFYELINRKKENNIILEKSLEAILYIEKLLIKNREEYNEAVEKYNMNLVKHKFLCVRVFRMKPLDKYSSKK